ncbi:VWA domain-containing protein [Mesoflavibacter sp. SCSIO 43206]|uniref:VWA domain-containing protein n=1 Tax=Mesoflavibacter sp. SCSIO 43206 TaxID=2779362 RepID=UPI001CA8CFC9|nr:VWA domain-containing protein [Mesoflavibacter sp. SCSIO 43206]UAB75285.1 von Willebrand factor type A domain-containing protein [Mesoflavibacter sp. SCSIO 43206]
MKLFLKSILVLFTIVQIQAQEKIISGVVSDENGLPLPSATVLVKGTSNGIQTDFDGNYSITAQVGDILVFSYVGYNTKEVTVGSSNTINVSMVPDNNLDEVIVVGYGTTRHRVKKERIKNASQLVSNKQQESSNVVQALSGQVAGVAVINSSGQPGNTANIRIRGYNSLTGNRDPLYVIDGKISSKDDLNTIKARKVSEVKVAKNFVGQALYGDKGKYGVVFVKTKNSNYVLPDIESIENESYTKIHENKFKTVSTSPLSTFSIDVDKAGYSNVRRLINNGQFVPANAVKIEEMINYFNYNYPQPKDEHPFSIHTEVAKTPWNQDTKLVKIGLQGKIYENENLPAANLTFLIDVSGSMGSPNKLGLLKKAFKLLVNQLREKDKVSIVVYAGAAGVVLKPTSGKHKDKIIEALDNLESGGSTAGGAGIQLAYKLAQENFNKKGNNRVILATDGDFNVGASSDQDMEDLITEKRKSGVFLSVLGFGYGNYKDSKLEILADKGNGNHAYIDTMQEARRIFESEFGGTLFTIAKDVKLQVEFNPNKVQAYRLIGYENRLLADEDFIDDTKDAGELGAGHTVTALYEVIPVGVKSEFIKDEIDLKYTDKKAINNYSDELFTVKFRYKKPDEDTSIEMVHVQKDETTEASENMNFASAVALFGMQLRQSQFYNNASQELVIQLAEKGRGEDKNGYRAEFIRLAKTQTF